MRGAIADPGSRARAVYPNARQLPAAVLAYRARGQSCAAVCGEVHALVPTGCIDPDHGPSDDPTAVP